MSSRQLECGIDMPDAGASAGRVVGAVLGHPLDLDAPGWAAMAQAALELFDADGDDAEAEVTTSWPQIADRLRRAYGEADRRDGEEIVRDHFELCPLPVRVAWEAAARHLANLCAFESEDIGKLTYHEEVICDWAKAAIAARTTQSPTP